MGFLKILEIVLGLHKQVSGSGRYPKVRTSRMSDRSRLHTQLSGNSGKNSDLMETNSNWLKIFPIFGENFPNFGVFSPKLGKILVITNLSDICL
jgi:hypothetical protein